VNGEAGFIRSPLHSVGSSWIEVLEDRVETDSLAENGVYAGRRSAMTHLSQNGKTANSFGSGVTGDFMFWPTGKHRFGWSLEPAYAYSCTSGHQESIGMSAGLLIGIPCNQAPISAILLGKA
jgi:hypothetical protein